MEKKHFLILTYPAQGHINPALHLAHHLSESTSAQVTFSTSISAHRKMFPDISSPNQEVTINSVTYLPFSDGTDDGIDPKTMNIPELFSKFKTIGSESIATMLDNLKSSGRPVHCVLYTFMLPWMAQMSRIRGISSAQYWIQPATVFLIYYHAFLHGYERTITEKINDPLSTVDLPGVPLLRVKDLPSFLMRSPDSDELTKELFQVFKEALGTLYVEKDITKTNSKVLVNTFEELELDALASVDDVDLIAVGPALRSEMGSGASTDLIKPDEKRYIKWLDSKPEKSVVYVSFGSLFVLKKEHVVEIRKGLEGSGRPYLWVLRDDSRYEDVEIDGQRDNGMIVSWCKQMDVLRHPSVGCFATHCGWNSTLESLVSGVPVVAVPQLSDQATNAVLMEKVWGNAVRSNNNGFVEGKELQRCLELVLGEGEEGVGIRQKAEMWKKKAMEALMEGGSSDRNLKAFVNGISKAHV